VLACGPFALFFDKGHLGPDHEPVKALVQDTIAVKVDFPAVKRFEEAVAFLREKAAHLTVGHRFESFC
jgi:hypothetical protein